MSQSKPPERWLIAAQLPLTLIILTWAPGNLLRATLLLLLWAATFRTLSRGELAFGFVMCVFFTGMNSASIQAGVFTFTEPDLFGQPWFEFLMWGFYTLHALRLLDKQAPAFEPRFIWPLAVLYSACFPIFQGGLPLLTGTGILLSIGLFRYHERRDWIFVGYFAAMGAAFEYTGVHTGLWIYPDSPPGGVPLWFITLWGGVGFFLHRLALPLLHKFGVYETCSSGSSKSC
jgi:hypothetical protein